MRLPDPVFHTASGIGRGWGRVVAQVLLLALLTVAPALDLAQDGQAAGVPSGPGSALDLCTVPAITPPLPLVAPVQAVARLTEAALTGAVPVLGRPIDHPPRSA